MGISCLSVRCRKMMLNTGNPGVRCKLVQFFIDAAVLEIAMPVCALARNDSIVCPYCVDCYYSMKQSFIAAGPFINNLRKKPLLFLPDWFIMY